MKNKKIEYIKNKKIEYIKKMCFKRVTDFEEKKNRPTMRPCDGCEFKKEGAGALLGYFRLLCKLSNGNTAPCDDEWNPNEYLKYLIEED